ncbi:MAG: ATP-binding cassette, subfamily multidrug efflux pump [Gemmatimonadales bacterium]|jgi:ATP-binding cassette subfamily B protein|nr:ATP-binding cassette, subfamily multidrug efflux pump [Gemmatimonadales bacterium]
MDQDEALDKNYDARLLRRLLVYLRPYRSLTVLAVLLLLSGAGLALVGPALTQRALDVAIPARDTGLLGTLALLFLAALVLEFLVEYGQTLLTTYLGQRVMYDLRMQIFSHLQRLSISYFDRNPVGRLMTRVTSDVETLNELFSSGVVTVFGDVFTLLAIMTMMLLIDWRLALVTFAVIPLVWLTARIFRRRVRQAFGDIRVRLARLNAFLQERLSGMRVVQLFGREADSAARFAELNKDHLEAHRRSITIYAVFFPVVELLTAVAMALLLYYGGLRALSGTITVGVLAAFIQLTRRFFQPLQDLSEKFNLLQSAMASSERVFALLDQPVTVLEPVNPVKLPEPVRGEVRFEGVWFRYSPEGPWVLRDVSFTASPGQTIALVGHTGAGKTTIVNLLLRFYDPDRGRILIDGVDIRQLATSDLRGLIGFVQQDLFLFAGDIQHNLTLDAPIPPEAARQAARRVGADRFIERLPAGYDHRLGERGRSLSVGERQLLSFARALALNPTILVLDEATSSVDAQAEGQIQVAIAELMTGRTSLVVAHRLSTILHADEILVLQHGEIRERGSHRELLAQRGLYERLYQLQLRGQAEGRTDRQAVGR